MTSRGFKRRGREKVRQKRRDEVKMGEEERRGRKKERRGEERR